MVTAVLLLACLVLAGAVGVLVVSVRRMGQRLTRLERDLDAGPPARSQGSPGPIGETPAQASPVPSSTGENQEYVITRLGEPVDEAVPTLESRLFADIVLRESVVKAASWVYGVRRGLSPANRNRIWFEMRREVKRARKQRRAEEREAIREWRARQRAAQRDQRDQRDQGPEESAA
jgi:hypothetical protein